MSGDRRNLDEGHALRAMFVARKEVFVDLLGWDVPMLDGRFELDQFDDVHARYLILLDAQGRHRASARLLPTTRPHILDTLFPELCQDDIPRGAGVWEITRFCLDRHQNAAERLAARNRLVSALADHALDHGIRRYTGVAELPWLRQIMRFGWRCRPLGLPHIHAGRSLSALVIDIDEDTISGLRDAGIYGPASRTPVYHLPPLEAA
ncbi:autoinducer synthase [Sphingomonas sp. CL5.1]|uniref:acyl-homoserine-lactone synthase n=1 Tax=Sphingomonas sp. CL5.1 TaxID=2653203 RepID=UPI001583D217|nr:acyl-homoserine-lactone synthase [Sphingomonas sp. CL5.1]QKR98305.1 autoinducer synthase [Sphingomonas sp. CL5.1]